MLLSQQAREARPRHGPMMSIPFFAGLLAMLAAWTGRRAVALWLWAATVGAILILFRLHATDALDIAL